MKLILGDNVKELAKFESESIDMALTSPPYDDMDEDFNPIPKRGLRKYKGYSWDFKGLAHELYRVMKKGAVLVWVVNDPTIKGSESLASSLQKIYFRRVGLNIYQTLIYKKTGIPFPQHVRYNRVFEYAIVFSKDKPKTLNLIKDKPNIWYGQKVARHHGNRKQDGIVHQNSAMKLGDTNRTIKQFGLRCNIWSYKTATHSASDNIAFRHPAIFPEKLAEDHILSWSNPSDIILDPFMGSGTTGKMALKNERDFIGIEISEEYYKIAEERIKNSKTTL